MAPFAPMPRASDRTATAEKPGCRGERPQCEAKIPGQIVEPAPADIPNGFLDLRHVAELEKRTTLGLLACHARGDVIVYQTVPMEADFVADPRLASFVPPHGLLRRAENAGDRR